MRKFSRNYLCFGVSLELIDDCVVRLWQKSPLAWIFHLRAHLLLKTRDNRITKLCIRWTKCESSKPSEKDSLESFFACKQINMYSLRIQETCANKIQFSSQKLIIQFRCAGKYVVKVQAGEINWKILNLNLF